VAYDEDLANRIRELLAGESAVTEKRMFGGLAFLINGNMSVSASGKGGGGGLYPALAGNAHVNATDPNAILGSIVHGKNIMPSWKGQLSAPDIAAVATYIRSAWGNTGGPVSPSDVAAIK